VVAAVSGGADSVSLLLALGELRKASKLDLRLVAAHLNHQLRGHESAADEEFVRHLTTGLGIELAVHRADISHEGNLEQNARIVRYEFLTETARNLDAFAVLTGHTINDQAETFLLNLIRGSGMEGLSGMKTIRELEEEKRESGEQAGSIDGKPVLFPILPLSSSPLLVRPLLTWAKRIDTEGFCHDMGVEYRYDTMNEDSAFRRVRIRKVLLPLLEDFNPRIVETLANTAALLRLQLSIPAGKKMSEQTSISLEELKLIDKNDCYSVLREWLARERGNLRGIGLKHIESIERLAFSRKSGKIVELPGGARVVKSGGELVFQRFGVVK